MTEVKLKRTVVHDGKEYNSITVDEPSVGGIEVYEQAKINNKSDLVAMLEMLAFETGVPIDALRKMRTGDLTNISEAMAPFLPKPDGGDTGEQSLPTAPTSSQLQ